jgi:ketosteroid isomerase-like protein
MPRQVGAIRQTTIRSRVVRARPLGLALPVSLRLDTVTLLGVTVLALALGTGCGPQPGRTVPGDSALADTLKGLIEHAYDFSRPGVLERMASLYPDSGRVISASGGQVMDSPDSIRAGLAEFWRTAGQYMREARWEWGKVYLDRLGPDAAVLTATWSIPHLAPTNRPHVIRGAWTAVFRRLAGRWKIVVEHLSAPPG